MSPCSTDRVFPYYGSALGVYGDGGYKFDGFTTGEILATGQPVDPEDVMKLALTVTLPVSIFSVRRCGFNPVKPTLKAPVIERLEQTFDDTALNFACEFKLLTPLRHGGFQVPGGLHNYDRSCRVNGRGLPLVHFSARPESLLSLKAPNMSQ